jgi:hypothetical protein
MNNQEVPSYGLFSTLLNTPAIGNAMKTLVSKNSGEQKKNFFAPGANGGMMSADRSWLTGEELKPAGESSSSGPFPLPSGSGLPWRPASNNFFVPSNQSSGSSGGLFGSIRDQMFDTLGINRDGGLFGRIGDILPVKESSFLNPPTYNKKPNYGGFLNPDGSTNDQTRFADFQDRDDDGYDDRYQQGPGHKPGTPYQPQNDAMPQPKDIYGESYVMPRDPRMNFQRAMSEQFQPQPYFGGMRGMPLGGAFGGFGRGMPFGGGYGGGYGMPFGGGYGMGGIGNILGRTLGSLFGGVGRAMPFGGGMMPSFGRGLGGLFGGGMQNFRQPSFTPQEPPSYTPQQPPQQAPQGNMGFFSKPRPSGLSSIFASLPSFGRFF